MKRVLMFIFIFCTMGLLRAQQPANKLDYDSVDFRKVRVNNLFFGSKKAELEKKFGKPQKTVTAVDPLKGLDMYSDYHYGKSTLRVSPAGVFNGFKLTETDFVLGYGTHMIRPGASLKEFAIYFPASFQSYARDAGGKFRLKIRPGNAFIVFKTKDGIVSEIETWEESLQ